jgi:hypothetical protein
VQRPEATGKLADEFLPVYDVSDQVSAVVGADVATTWAALMDVDLIEHGGRGQLVSRLRPGRRRPPQHLRLRDLARLAPGEAGWVLLGERPGEEIALGLIGRLWMPAADYVAAPPGAFRGFDEPGYAKTVCALTVRPLGERMSMLSAVTRTATTDERSRRRFRRYWRLGVGSGAHGLAGGLLDAAREDAERRMRPSSARPPA